MSFHYSTYFSSIFSLSFHNFLLYFPNHFTIQLIFLPYFLYHFTFQLAFFHVVHILSLFDLLFFHIFQIISLFNRSLRRPRPITIGSFPLLFSYIIVYMLCSTPRVTASYNLLRTSPYHYIPLLFS
jgi:hypothetical protein